MMKAFRSWKETVFYNANDAELALRIVIRRAFPLIALNSSYRPKVNTTYILFVQSAPKSQT